MLRVPLKPNYQLAPCSGERLAGQEPERPTTLLVGHAVLNSIDSSFSHPAPAQHNPNTRWGWRCRPHTTRHPTAKVSPAACSAWLSWPTGSSPRKGSHQKLQTFKLIHIDKKMGGRIMSQCKRSVRPMLTTAARLATSRRVLSPNRMYNHHRSWQTFCSNTCRPKYPQNPINRLFRDKKSD